MGSSPTCGLRFCRCRQTRKQSVITFNTQNHACFLLIILVFFLFFLSKMNACRPQNSQVTLHCVVLDGRAIPLKVGDPVQRRRFVGLDCFIKPHCVQVPSSNLTLPCKDIKCAYCRFWNNRRGSLIILIIPVLTSSEARMSQVASSRWTLNSTLI